jgi:hypothetical protein
MKFDPIGMGGMSDVGRPPCVCIYNGPGCGPITRLYLCVCKIGGVGTGP